MSNQFRSSIIKYDNSEETKYLTHGIFRWYGKLVPNLVSDIIDLYASEGDSIVANFNGSGTIALESIIRNISVVGVDINPLAILISKVKTQKLFIRNLEETIDKIISTANEYNVNDDELMELYEPYKWYSKDSIFKLLKLMNSINLIKNKDEKDFFIVSLLSIVRDCSKIDSRCVNHIVVDNKRKEQDVFKKFKEVVMDNYNAIKELNNFNKLGKCEFRLCDARNMDFIKNNSIDLVFSHPPYLNAINYYNIHRLCTDLMGWSYDEIRSEDFSSKKLDVFLKFIKETYTESYRQLKIGKYLVAVIGDVRYKGNIIPLGVEFINILREIGFDIEDIFIWELTKKAGMSVARRGNHIDHNYVITAKKKG